MELPRVEAALLGRPIEVEAAERAPHFPLGRWEPAACLALLAIVGGLYLHRLSDVPAGLYFDETSVGYNAWAIGHTLHDEHRTALPLFFECFGDYKSPLYVYLDVVTVALFGATPFGVRLASVLYAFAMAAVLYLLLGQWTEDWRLARWFALLSLVAPAIFTFGRHAVSEASSLPFWITLGFLALLRFERQSTARAAVWAGLALGICTYAYTTARLLAPLTVVGAAACLFPSRAHRRLLPQFLGAASMAGLPMAVFMAIHPGMLTKRFDTLSIFKDHPPRLVSFERAVRHFGEHLLSIDFLFRTGDHNLRHNIGVGLLPVWLAIPFCLGLAALWQRRSSPMARFLLLFLVLAPIPVSLCDDVIPHASRMLHFVPYAYAVAGLAAADWLRQGAARAAIACALGLALLEGGLFLDRYFDEYAPRSQAAFDGGAGRALELAFGARPPGGQLFLSPELLGAQDTYVKFWGKLDPFELARRGIDGMGIHRLMGGTLPSGAIVALRGGFPPGQPAERIGESDTPSGRALYSVYRIR
ncbi:MAG: ArnT family glycosyltransferase [Deltaproteobacteria bacterium]